MANPEHLSKLKERVKEWNQWRKDNPNVHSDLSDVDLSGVKLCFVNLSEAKIRWADLSNADLYRPNFRGANLNQENRGTSKNIIA